jgi:hypothetical protein
MGIRSALVALCLAFPLLTSCGTVDYKFPHLPASNFAIVRSATLSNSPGKVLVRAVEVTRAGSPYARKLKP